MARTNLRIKGDRKLSPHLEWFIVKSLKKVFWDEPRPRVLRTPVLEPNLTCKKRELPYIKNEVIVSPGSNLEKSPYALSTVSENCVSNNTSLEQSVGYKFFKSWLADDELQARRSKINQSRPRNSITGY